VLVHHGTAQVLASLVLVDHRAAGVGTPTAPPARRGVGTRRLRRRGGGQPPRGISLAPGDTALAQLRIAATTPLGALPGDRFIVRGFVRDRDHGTTIGGGRVIRVLAPRARKGSTTATPSPRLAAARHDQRLALDVKTAAFAGLGLPTSCAHRRARRRARAGCSPR